jgi:hypothetical protein
MDINSLWTSLGNTLGETLPNVLAGVAILVVGWIIAVVARAAVRRLAHLAKLNARIPATDGGRLDGESALGSVVFWLVMLLALVGFFSVLELGSVAEPLESLASRVLNYAPNLIGGGILAAVAWVVATAARSVTAKVLGATKLDETVTAEAGMRPVSQSAGDVLYGLILLLFLPAILGALQLGGLLTPVQEMVERLLGMLPNLLGAAVIGFVGWFVAGLLRRLVEQLLAGIGFDGLGQRIGLEDDVRLSKVVGLLVFIFVFVPTLIAALNALQIDAISAPAIEMLGMFLAAVPRILAAVIILTLAYFLARFIARLLSTMLRSVGVDSLPSRLGLGELAAERLQVSDLAGRAASVLVILFASVEAAGQLGFDQVADLVGSLIEFAGQIILGSLILVAGYWLAGLAHAGILKVSGASARGLANLARVAILGLILAMGLRAMGIADDIVNLAFALILGAVAVAIALSFGLGGREAAGRQMEHWFASLRGEK